MVKQCRLQSRFHLEVGIVKSLLGSKAHLQRSLRQRIHRRSSRDRTCHSNFDHGSLYTQQCEYATVSAPVFQERHVQIRKYFVLRIVTGTQDALSGTRKRLIPTAVLSTKTIESGRGQDFTVETEVEQ